MKTFWKVLLGLALVVPMVAYVAGSLVASAADDPAPRETIQIQEPSSTPTPKPKPSKTPDAAQESDDVEVITPEYEDFDDHDDHGDDDGEDHRGPGGGGDDDRDDDRDDDGRPGGEG